MAEAGTGTGKTFAYLVPALLSGGRVMIATGTRTLQDQLFERDLPRVREALGVDAQIALLKGRANYVCLHHLSRNLADGRFARREDIVDLRRIDSFARITRTGDRASLASVAEDSAAWAMATSTRENCLGQECPDHGRCFVFKARQAAQQADVVVVNHHLFCADLMLRDEGISELLPTTSTLIFDEAHQLPEVATQFFGQAVSSRQLVEFARDAMKSGLTDARDAAEWTSLSAQVEQAVRELRLQAGAPGRVDARGLRARPALREAVVGCAHAIAALQAPLAAAASRGRDVARCGQRAGELQARLFEWLEAVYGPAVSPDGATADFGADHAPVDALAADALDRPGSAQDPPWAAGDPASDATAGSSDPGRRDEHQQAQILWADVSPHGCTLHSTPLSVAAVFRRHRMQNPRAWVFLSATLAVSDKLDHFASLIGVEDADRHLWPSPFDFASRGLLHVPRGLGDPSSAGFAERMVAAIWPLIRANRGRAFVLCTTLRMVERASTLLAECIRRDDEPLQLLQQGRAPRAELLDRFRREPAPVLVGSASFWEGVDVPGDQLSLVIIDKLPFAPPDDPVVQARAQALRAQGLDPFREQHLPAAAMALKQGAGRLIRSESDRGLLVVCDGRLADRPYGRWLLRSLPPFRRTRDAAEAEAFLTARAADTITGASDTCGAVNARTGTSSDCLPESREPSAHSTGS